MGARHRKRTVEVLPQRRKRTLMKKVKTYEQAKAWVESDLVTSLRTENNASAQIRKLGDGFGVYLRRDIK